MALIINIDNETTILQQIIIKASILIMSDTNIEVRDDVTSANNFV